MTSPFADLLLVARGSTWLILGRCARQAFLYGVLLLLAADLGSTHFGRFLVALALLQVGAACATSGARDAAARYIAWALAEGSPREASRAAAIAAIIGLLLSTSGALVIAGTSEWLATVVGLSAGGATLMNRVALTLPALTGLQIAEAILRGYRKPKRMVAWTDVMWPLLLLVVFALWDGDAAGADAAMTLFCLVTWVVGAFAAGDAASAAREAITHTPTQDSARLDGGMTCPPPPRRSLREQLQFALPLTAAGAVAAGLTWADHILLGRLASPDSVGLYGPAARTALLLGLGLQGVNAMLGPSLARHLGRGERESAARLFAVANRWAVTWALVGTGALIAAGAPLLRLFGAEWEQAYPWMLVLALGWLVNAGAGSVGLWLKMEGRVSAVVVPGVVCLMIGIALDLVLIPRLDALGAAIGTASAMTAQNLWMSKLATPSAGRGWNLPPLPGMGLIGASTAVAWALCTSLSSAPNAIAMGAPLVVLGTACIVGRSLLLQAEDLGIVNAMKRS